jgi:hypothetical protein
MGRKKLPECKCIACERFRFDGPDAYAAIERWDGGDKKFLALAKRDMVLGTGCDYCKYDWGTRVTFVPKIIKDFFRIEYLCEQCRVRIEWKQRELYWPICWGSTSDDEIKWFLLHITLERFNEHVRALSPAQIAKDKAYQEWLASLPKWEEEPALDLDIKIKRRVRPRVIDVGA